MSRDTICVYRAASVGQADLVVIWLEEHGIAAFVRDRLTAETLPTSLIVAPQGIEVCVSDASQAEDATALLRDHFASLKQPSPADPADRPIQVTCSICGGISEFAAAQRGSVQVCSFCGEFIDAGSE